ncbi:hypothetical protein KQX54_019433 [Cotesia glomerata]|uniref:Uncharacterized protein n=1 Tax=Cotesia glomerata TaxID=32391 RepID=A0AAV7IAA6_COTGL|nr:hypothetical protein KQX54_019433 [Cotesia glomerata]
MRSSELPIVHEKGSIRIIHLQLFAKKLCVSNMGRMGASSLPPKQERLNLFGTSQRPSSSSTKGSSTNSTEAGAFEQYLQGVAAS